VVHLHVLVLHERADLVGAAEHRWR
jgi:hypothetical protein